jgi:hypothetical protein
MKMSVNCGSIDDHNDSSLNLHEPRSTSIGCARVRSAEYRLSADPNQAMPLAVGNGPPRSRLRGCGWNVVLPNGHQDATDATGQRDWRPCDRCAGLFYAPDGDASPEPYAPRGGPHRVPAGSWLFFLPAREMSPPVQ